MAKKPACIDTCICIDFLRNREPGLTLFTRLLHKYTPCITAVTAFELILGHAKMKRKDSIDGFISQFDILPFDLKAATSAANIQAALDNKGAGIGIPDTLIAGICIANSIPLLTLNEKHFSRVAGLELCKSDLPSAPPPLSVAGI